MKKQKVFQLRQMKINHPRFEYEDEYEAAKAWCESQKMKDWYIRSFDGLKLHASYFPAENPRRTVLMCHGYKGTRFGSIAGIARFLHEQGSNLLFIDQRCCGESEGRFITFGVKEHIDVLEWLRRLDMKNEEGLPIYLYGQSMGAVTVMMAAGHRFPGSVKGLIVDAGFHSMENQMRDMAREWFHIHHSNFFLFRMDFFCRVISGFRMKDSDTTEALGKNDRPILFFHGSKDTYVLPENSIRNYELCTAPKELTIIPDARHLCCAYAAPRVYREKVRHFFEKYDNITV